MSCSSVSSVGKYLLSSAGPYVPAGPNNNPIETNQTFPYDYDGALKSAFNLNLARTIQTATVSGYSTIKNGEYTFRASSYATLSGTAMNPCRAFMVPSGGYASCLFFGRLVAAPTWTGFYNDSNTLVNYTQEPYSLLTYLGGGSGKFWTTIYDTNQSVSGEWIEVKFPFKALVKSIIIRPITGNIAFCPRAGKVLGSDDGVTWSLIGDYAQTTTAYSFYTNPFPSNTKRFQYIRFVVTGCGHYKIALETIKYEMDIYDLTADTSS
jgi:hypothetical protein